MIPSYTVIYETEQSITKYGPRGDVVSQTLTRIKHTVTGLPLQTAQMYKQTDKYGTVEIIKEIPTVDGRSNRRDRVEFGDVRTGKSNRPEPTRLAAQNKSSPTESAKNKAARTGDLSAAISA